ncbi:ELMO domain-containing protein C56G7.3 [Diplonema papillatum]|nr:ELMO domain-containing protein C56G7.3 [Diplonema papillatum]
MGENLTALEQEFEAVTAERDSHGVSGPAKERPARFAAIRYETALAGIRNPDVPEGHKANWRRYQKALKDNHPHDASSGCFASWFEALIPKKLWDDRDFVFCITTNASGREHVEFDWENETHARLAATVYKRLRNKPPHAPVPACGDHWAEIGFQGASFVSDAGRLGSLFVLLQMLHFINHSPKLAARTYMESQPPSPRPFSWALWSIFCSTRALEAFGRKKLNRHIAKTKDVMLALNEFHIGVFAELFERWAEKDARVEMHDFNALKKELTTWSLSKPDAVFKRAKLAQLDSHDKREAVITDGPPLVFTNMEEIKAKPKKTEE